MTQEEYFRRCQEVTDKIKELLPWDDGWRWSIVVRNDVIGKWATGGNLDQDGNVEMWEAALKANKAGAN